jgi:hypothetical protein
MFIGPDGGGTDQTPVEPAPAPEAPPVQANPPVSSESSETLTSQPPETLSSQPDHADPTVSSVAVTPSGGGPAPTGSGDASFNWDVPNGPAHPQSPSGGAGATAGQSTHLSSFGQQVAATTLIAIDGGDVSAADAGQPAATTAAPGSPSGSYSQQAAAAALRAADGDAQGGANQPASPSSPHGPMLGASIALLGGHSSEGGGPAAAVHPVGLGDAGSPGSISGVPPTPELAHEYETVSSGDLAAQTHAAAERLADNTSYAGRQQDERTLADGAQVLRGRAAAQLSDEDLARAYNQAFQNLNNAAAGGDPAAMQAAARVLDPYMYAAFGRMVPESAREPTGTASSPQEGPQSAVSIGANNLYNSVSTRLGGGVSAQYVAGALSGVVRMGAEIPMEMTDMARLGYHAAVDPVAFDPAHNLMYSQLGNAIAQHGGSNTQMLQISATAIAGHVVNIVAPEVGEAMTLSNFCDAVQSGDPRQIAEAGVVLAPSAIARGTEAVSTFRAPRATTPGAGPSAPTGQVIDPTAPVDLSARPTAVSTSDYALPGPSAVQPPVAGHPVGAAPASGGVTGDTIRDVALPAGVAPAPASAPASPGAPASGGLPGDTIRDVAPAGGAARVPAPPAPGGDSPVTPVRIDPGALPPSSENPPVLGRDQVNQIVHAQLAARPATAARVQGYYDALPAGDINFETVAHAQQGIAHAAGFAESSVTRVYNQQEANSFSHGVQGVQLALHEGGQAMWRAQGGTGPAPPAWMTSDGRAFVTRTEMRGVRADPVGTAYQPRDLAAWTAERQGSGAAAPGLPAGPAAAASLGTARTEPMLTPPLGAGARSGDTLHGVGSPVVGARSGDTLHGVGSPVAGGRSNDTLSGLAPPPASLGSVGTAPTEPMLTPPLGAGGRSGDTLHGVGSPVVGARSGDTLHGVGPSVVGGRSGDTLQGLVPSPASPASPASPGTAPTVPGVSPATEHAAVPAGTRTPQGASVDVQNLDPTVEITQVHRMVGNELAGQPATTARVQAVIAGFEREGAQGLRSSDVHDTIHGLARDAQRRSVDRVYTQPEANELVTVSRPVGGPTQFTISDRGSYETQWHLAGGPPNEPVPPAFHTSDNHVYAFSDPRAVEAGAPRAEPIGIEYHPGDLAGIAAERPPEPPPPATQPPAPATPQTPPEAAVPPPARNARPRTPTVPDNGTPEQS